MITRSELAEVQVVLSALTELLEARNLLNRFPALARSADMLHREPVDDETLAYATQLISATYRQPKEGLNDLSLEDRAQNDELRRLRRRLAEIAGLQAEE